MIIVGPPSEEFAELLERDGSITNSDPNNPNITRLDSRTVDDVLKDRLSRQKADDFAEPLVIDGIILERSPEEAASLKRLNDASITELTKAQGALRKGEPLCSSLMSSIDPRTEMGLPGIDGIEIPEEFITAFEKDMGTQIAATPELLMDAVANNGALLSIDPAILAINQATVSTTGDGTPASDNIIENNKVPRIGFYS